MSWLSEIKLKTLSRYAFYLSLCDISSDICYVLNRDKINEFLWKLSIGTLLLNIVGPMIILVFGQIISILFKALIFKSETLKKDKFFKEIKEMINLSHLFVSKTILDLDIPKKKAIYRVSFLIHIAFESFPQLILQSITNYKFHYWEDPFSLISIASSISMIIIAIIISIKTEKYYL